MAFFQKPRVNDLIYNTSHDVRDSSGVGQLLSQHTKVHGDQVDPGVTTALTYPKFIIRFCRLDLLSEGRIGFKERSPLVDNITQQLLTGKVVVDLVRGVV